MKTTHYWTLFFILGIVWGGSFIAIAEIVKDLPPWFGASSRLLLASVILFFIAAFQKQSVRIPTDAMFKIWFLGVIMIGLPFALLFWGEQSISPGLAGVLNGTVPVWTAFFYVIMSRLRAQPLSSTMIWGLVLGFGGILAIFLPELQLPLKHTELIGGLAVLGMALSYAIGNVAGHKLLNHHSHIHLTALTFHQHLGGCLFLCILSLLSEDWPHHLGDWDAHSNSWIWIIYLAVVPSALGFTLYFKLLKEVGAVRAGAIAYLIPVAAIGFDYLILGHIPTWNSFAGMILILMGLRLIRA